MEQRIKVTNNEPRRYKIAPFLNWLRETILYIALIILAIIAAFEGGMLFEHRSIDNYAKRIKKVEDSVKELSRIVEADKAIKRGIQKRRDPDLGKQ